MSGVERFEERAKALSHAYLGLAYVVRTAPQLSEDLWDEDLSRPLADLELLRDLPRAHPVCHETQKLVRSRERSGLSGTLPSIASNPTSR